MSRESHRGSGDTPGLDKVFSQWNCAAGIRRQNAAIREAELPALPSRPQQNYCFTYQLTAPDMDSPGLSSSAAGRTRRPSWQS